MPIGLTNTSSPNLELVKTALDKLLNDAIMQNVEYGKATASDPVIFNQQASTKAAEVASVLGGGGYAKKTITGTAQDVTASKSTVKNAPAPQTTIIAEFKQDLDISRSFMADDQHNAVAMSVQQRGIAWKASIDRNAFSFYANGTGTTVSTTIDGVALFSNLHVNANGDTVDNLETGALSDSTLNTSVVSLRNQLNQDGVKVGYEPAFLLTSNAQHKDAMTIAKSVLKSGGAQNDLNYYSEMYPGMKVLFNQFIDDTSTTMYVVGAQQHGVIRYLREGLNSTLVDWKYNDNDLYKYKFRSREEISTLVYNGLVGSTGA